MNKRFFAVLPLVLCAALTFVFSDFSATAQTASPNRQRQVPSPSPIPSPTPNNPTAAPTVSPTPEVEETIIVETELVNLNVRVIDRNNRPINNISQKEFQIFEDGVPQPIEFFSKSEVPTNYTLVIDNSGSLRMQLEKVIEASKILINSNRADDETSIIRFVSRDKISIEQDFTSDKNELSDSLENLYTEGGQTAIIDAVYLAAEKVTEYESREKNADRKRRALILISDGEDRDSFYKEPQLFELLRESDVQIYVIGFVSELTKESGFISKSPQAKAKAFLEKLATTTGGKSYFPNDVSELDNIAKDISSELRTQYSIGYIPTNDRNDGSFRNIKVQVADGPNKQKRIAVTRAGRTATPDGSAPKLQNNKKQ